MWLEDQLNEQIHASLENKALTLCGEEIKTNFKFKSIYDISTYSKCFNCLEKVKNIYRGALILQ